MFGAAAAPSGWLLCDGAAVSRSTYSDLFDIIGETYGVGDGSTTFNVPLSANKMPRGNTPGASGGSDNAVLVSHRHSTVIGSHGHTLPGHASSGTANGQPSFKALSSADTKPVNSTNIGAKNSNYQGVSGTGANIPAYFGVNFIIKT